MPLILLPGEKDTDAAGNPNASVWVHPTAGIRKISVKESLKDG